MNAAALLNDLRQSGISVTLQSEGALKVVPSRRLTPENRAFIRAHKSEIVDLLVNEQNAPKSPFKKPLLELVPRGGVACGGDIVGANWRELEGAAASRAINRLRLQLWDAISCDGQREMPADVVACVLASNETLLCITATITRERRSCTETEAAAVDSALEEIEYAHAGLIPLDSRKAPRSFTWRYPEHIANDVLKGTEKETGSETKSKGETNDVRDKS